VSSNQLIVARYHYDPYGNTLSASGPLAEANLYRFSSKEYHPNSGLVYYLYRYYDPNLQRWVNRDPIGEAGGINLFAANQNDPLSRFDPFGFEDCPKPPWSERAKDFGKRAFERTKKVMKVVTGLVVAEKLIDASNKFDDAKCDKDAQERAANGPLDPSNPEEFDRALAAMCPDQQAQNIAKGAEAASGLVDATTSIALRPGKSAVTCAEAGINWLGDKWEWLRSEFRRKPNPQVNVKGIGPGESLYEGPELPPGYRRVDEFPRNPNPPPPR